MIEAYAFLAMFTVQVLAGSVLFPERAIRSIRGWAREFGSERFTQQYPEVDYDKWVARFANVFRAANFTIALLGLLLLGWLYTVTNHPDWAGAVKMPLVAYIVLQFAPLALFALYGVVRYFKVLVQPSREAKRTATLQRRGLFDFVSPFAVWLAVLTYVGFVVFAIYLDLEVYQNASLSKSCYIAIGVVTGVYALNTFVIYKFLYGRKNPLVTHEGRVHSIGVNVKSAVYGSIAPAWFFILLGVLGQPHLKEWVPFAITLFIVVTWLMSLMGVSSPPRPQSGDLGSSSEVPS
jgi:hypothetical protein